jgi:hypothetical protein
MTRTTAQIERCREVEDVRDKIAADLDELSVSALIRFFETLDRWDREEKRNAEIV